jgi:hypothetical protein
MESASLRKSRFDGYDCNIDDSSFAGLEHDDG